MGESRDNSDLAALADPGDCLVEQRVAQILVECLSHEELSVAARRVGVRGQDDYPLLDRAGNRGLQRLLVERRNCNDVEPLVHEAFEDAQLVGCVGAGRTLLHVFDTKLLGGALGALLHCDVVGNPRNLRDKCNLGGVVLRRRR